MLGTVGDGNGWGKDPRNGGVGWFNGSGREGNRGGKGVGCVVGRDGGGRRAIRELGKVLIIMKS